MMRLKSSVVDTFVIFREARVGDRTRITHRARFVGRNATELRARGRKSRTFWYYFSSRGSCGTGAYL